MNRNREPDDPDATTVRPPLADDLLDPSPAEDDLMDDDEFMAPGGPRPSRVTRILLVLLICAVGVLIGVQLAKLTGGSAGAAGAPDQSRRLGPPGTGSPGAGAAAGPRSTTGSATPAVTGEVSSVKAHVLVVLEQGASRTVTFTDDTTLTASYGHGALGVGDAVTVFGSRAADGSVNATSIVVR